MTTAADIQKIYEAIHRSTLDPAEASETAQAIDDGALTLDTYITGQLSEVRSTTQAGIAISAFVTGLTPNAQHLNELKAAGDLQIASYTAMGVSDPDLGPFEAFGKGFAADHSTGFAAKYGALSSADFIAAIYGEVFDVAPTADALANLQSQIDYFIGLYTKAGISTDDATLQAKGAVLGQIVGYAFIDPKFADASTLDDLVSSALGKAATGDTSIYDAPLVEEVRPPVDGGLTGPTGPVTYNLQPGLDNFAGTSFDDTITGNIDSFNAIDTIDGAGGADTLIISFDAPSPGFVAVMSPPPFSVPIANVSNIEIATITSTSPTDVTANTTSWTGLTQLTVSSTDGATITAAATTAVTVQNNTGAVEINGGSFVDVALTNPDEITINDVNAGSSSASGVITSVKVDGYTRLTINDNALGSLILAHGSGNVAIGNSGLVGTTNKTLAVSVDSLTGGTLDDTDIYETLNVTTTGGNSKLANITDSALKTLTLDGTANLSLTSTAGMSHLRTVAVSGSAGLTADLSGASVEMVDAHATSGAMTVTIDGSKANYIGSSGVDIVTLAPQTVSNTISLGDGDDTLILGALSTTGGINGGLGTNTLSMDATAAAVASETPDFLRKVAGFDHLTLTGSGSQTIDLNQLGIFDYVTTQGGNNLTLEKMTSGGTLVLEGAGTAYTLDGTSFQGASDVVNLILKSPGVGVGFASTGITATNVETINITTDDTQATPSGSPNDTVTLLGDDLKIITVTGDAGLTLTATSTAATSIDAQGITAGGFTFTSGALADAAAIKGSLTGTNTIDFSAATDIVTYTGGSGNDIVTSTNAQDNVVHLGDGTNSYSGNGAGANTIDGGTGADTVVLGGGISLVNLGNGANSFTATTGNNTYTGGDGIDTVTVGGGINNIWTGTGADIVHFTAVAAYSISFSTILDAHSGLTISFSHTSSMQTSLGSSLGDFTASSFESAVNAAAFSNSAGTTSVMSWFTFSGDTYIVQDNSTSTSFVDGVDDIVKLVGLVDLSAAHFIPATASVFLA